MRPRKLFLAVIILTLATSLLSGCSSGGTGGKSEPPGQMTFTGTIETESPNPGGRATVQPSGGSVSVSAPGSILSGMEISVPSGAYTTETDFTITYAPVKTHTFGKEFDPISPMITVDNGEKLAAEPVQLTIPVSVPEGHFAMGFYYDETTGTLEGLPLVSSDAVSVTVATRHFSNIIISSTPQDLLNVDVDSGFLPGVDDWQFTNYGSYIAQEGHCSGQSMSAMWYYIAKPDGNNVHLYGRYDNNGRTPATPDFWLDDSAGYRLASVVQNEEDFGSLGRKKGLRLSSDPLKTWNLFAYSLQLTKQPQMVEIYDTTGQGGGHAMIVYRVSGGKMYVADPNYPGDTGRKIEFSNGKFTPYNSGKNAEEIAAGKGHVYDQIVFVGKSALVDWNKMYERWGQVMDGTSGDDNFPSYTINRLDENGNPHKLTDGYATSQKFLRLSLVSVLDSQAGIFVYRNGQRLVRQDNGYELMPGENLLGIAVLGMTPESTWKYIDFEYVTVVYTPPPTTTSPATTTTPNVALKRWKLADTVLPKLPEMPVEFSDQFGNHSMTLTVTGNQIISDVRTSGPNGTEKGASIIKLTINGMPDTVAQGDKVEITGNWEFTVSGEPRFTSSSVELRRGDFQATSKPIRVNDNPTGSLTFTWSPGGDEFEVTARLGVYGDTGRIKWIYRVE